MTDKNKPINRDLNSIPKIITDFPKKCQETIFSPSESLVVDKTEPNDEQQQNCSKENGCKLRRYETFDIKDDSPKKTQGVSLQSAFRKYRNKKQRLLASLKELDTLTSSDRSHVNESLLTKNITITHNDKEHRMKLRLSFVDRARHYIGVPYAKKYWKAGDPEYDSPLFLDCCGLVRRAMRDLRKEFGFCLGPWNQSYQFDTLPIVINDLDDTLPGDLVFTMATYYQPKVRPQKHDLTHVEILLGQGPKTIGSRWHTGKVQEFDDYKFVSTSYHSQKYVFKSIETWLNGVCKSHCEEHRWSCWETNFFPSKRSIFALESEKGPIDQDGNVSENDDDDGDNQSAEHMAELNVDESVEVEVINGGIIENWAKHEVSMIINELIDSIFESSS